MKGIYSSMQRKEKCLAANQLHDAAKRLYIFATNRLHHAAKRLCSGKARHSGFQAVQSKFTPVTGIQIPCHWDSDFRIPIVIEI